MSLRSVDPCRALFSDSHIFGPSPFVDEIIGADQAIDSSLEAAAILGGDRALPIDRPSSPPPGIGADPCRTPPRAPQKKTAVEVTPEKNKVARDLLQQMEPDGAESSLTRAEREALQEGIDSIATVTDTPIKKKRSEVASRTYGAFLRMATPPSELSFEELVESPSFHRRASPVLLNSPWLGRMLSQVEEIYRQCEHRIPEFPGLPDIIIDLTHVSSPQQGKRKKMGHHFCPPLSEEYRSLQKIVVNETTRVFAAKYEDGCGGLKSSSYFPEWIETEEQLLAALLSGREVGRQNNRTLIFVEGKGIPFVCEAFDRERADRRIINSVFPIFSFTDLSCDYSGDLFEASLVGEDKKMKICAEEASLIDRAKEMLRYTISSSIDLTGLPADPSWHEEWLARRPCVIDDSKCPVRYFLPASSGAPERLVFDFAVVFEIVTNIPKGIFVAIPLDALKDVTGSSAIVRSMKLRSRI
jgi:hypothetical protein